MSALTYQYGACEPIEALSVVRDQMRLAHRYQNALIEIERTRRASAEAVLRTHHPELAPLEAAAQAADAEREAFFDSLKAANAKARTRTETKEQKARLAELRKAASAAWKAFSVARKTAWADEAMKSEQKSVNETAHDAEKAARAECGVYWGTYLIIEEAVEKAKEKAKKGPPPRFQPWDGDAMVAVQIQHGMGIDELSACDDTRVRVAGAGRDRELWLRIGSGGKGAREPIWTRVPFTMHRPLPEGARIKWAKLHVRRIATHEKWFVNFSIDAPEGSRESEYDRTFESHTAVGVDLGWRQVRDGLRVAFWCGSDGEQGEMVIPTKDVGRWLWSRQWQAKADVSFDGARDRLAAWMDVRQVPAWLTERTEHLAKWRAAAKLASVVLHWRGNRFEGDHEIFTELENWRSSHRKLFEAARCSEVKAVRWRTDFYRNFAVMLRRRYARCAIEDIDWTKCPKGFGHWRIASPGFLAETLKVFGPATEKKPAKDTTARCWKCGELTGEPKPENLHHTCASCGNVEDQDRNAAMRLLAALSDASVTVAQGA